MTTEEIFSKPLIYLAGPYSHKTLEFQNLRAAQHCTVAADLRRRGFCVYSPIAETCNISAHTGLGGSWEDWRGHDLRLLAACTHIWVLTIQGWTESRGVRGEIKFCIQNKIPIALYDMDSGVYFDVEPEAVLGMLGVTNVNELND